MSHTLEFKWTVSHGYNICSLYVNGVKVSSCNGGGYDMQGTSLADWMLDTFKEQLKKLNTDLFYGLTFIKHYKNGKYRDLKRYSEGCEIYLDGACGFEYMVRILEKLKYNIQCVSWDNNRSTYILTHK